jgi:hypothetical protein
MKSRWNLSYMKQMFLYNPLEILFAEVHFQPFIRFRLLRKGQQFVYMKRREILPLLGAHLVRTHKNMPACKSNSSPHPNRQLSKHFCGHRVFLSS